MRKNLFCGMLAVAMLSAGLTSAAEQLSALDFGNSPTDGKLKDGEITKGLFVHDGIPVSSAIECSPELLQEILDSHLLLHARSSNPREVEYSLNKVLNFGKIKVCNFSTSYASIPIFGRGVKLVIDSERSELIGFVGDVYDGPATTYFNAFEKAHVIEALGKKIGSLEDIEEVRIVRDSTVLKKTDGTWRLHYIGQVALKKTDGQRLGYRFDLSKLGADFIDYETRYNDDYSWSCPSDTDLVLVRYRTREDYPLGLSVAYMDVADHDITLTGLWEAVDYCGEHIYSSDITMQKCICSESTCNGMFIPIWCFEDRMGFTTSDDQYLLESDGLELCEQNSLFWGDFIRDYFLYLNDSIDFGDYTHQFNIVNYYSGMCRSGLGCYRGYGLAGDFIRDESDQLPSIALHTSYSMPLQQYSCTNPRVISHEYAHLVHSHVRPDRPGYLGSGYFNWYGIHELMAQIYGFQPWVDTGWLCTPGDFNCHTNESSKLCEILKGESLANCRCSANNCITVSTCNSDEHCAGRAFIQAYTEILENRSYSESWVNCTNNYTCFFLDPSFPSCDSRSGANSCYRTIGSYDQDDVELALWYAYSLIPTYNEDSDLLAFNLNFFLLNLYSSMALYNSVAQEFASHNICATPPQYCQ